MQCCTSSSVIVESSGERRGWLEVEVVDDVISGQYLKVGVTRITDNRTGIYLHRYD